MYKRCLMLKIVNWLQNKSIMLMHSQEAMFALHCRSLLKASIQKANTECNRVYANLPLIRYDRYFSKYNSTNKMNSLIDVESPNVADNMGIESNRDDLTSRVQQQVSDVVDQMRVNVHNLMQRDEHLEALKHRSESLSAGANQFSSQSRTVHRRNWWNNMKMNIIIGGVVISFFLIILIIIISKSHKNK
ncbi:hypothetical protein GJ496_008563 [Pomphorhynchus laevis]|nr:hypothetical protein GJ496_008563 [Pomphorhynchus laevis]